MRCAPVAKSASRRADGLRGPEGADADAARDDAGAQRAGRDTKGRGGAADAGPAGGPRGYEREFHAWALDMAQIRVQCGVPGEFGCAGGLGRHAATVGAGTAKKASSEPSR